MYPLPGAVLAPEPTVVIDDLPWREVMRQQAPGTPTPYDIKDSIQDFALELRDIGLEQFPLMVADFGRVRFSGFRTPRLTHRVHQFETF